MDIIQRDNRYYLQLTNGELELTEQQAKKRLERGDQLKDYLDVPETSTHLVPDFANDDEAEEIFPKSKPVHTPEYSTPAPPPPISASEPVHIPAGRDAASDFSVNHNGAISGKAYTNGAATHGFRANGNGAAKIPDFDFGLEDFGTGGFSFDSDFTTTIAYPNGTPAFSTNGAANGHHNGHTNGEASHYTNTAAAHALIDANILSDSLGEGQSYISSGKYFDNLIREFEQIYKFSDDKQEAIDKLTRFCKNAITKLHHDRRNPKSDHVVIDYYILSWSRVISFLQSLVYKEKEAEEAAAAKAAAEATSQLTETLIQPQPRNLTRQLLIVQLLQAEGLFPISDALQGIKQADIINIICVMLHADKESVQEAMQTSSAILLKRGISGSNIEDRIHMLQDMEKYFEQLPYSNIISRIKLLIKIYYEMAAEK
jgi:hypothetical protein